MNAALQKMAKTIASTASKLPPKEGLELISDFLEFAGDAEEVVSLRNAYVEMYAGHDQLQLFAKDSGR